MSAPEREYWMPVPIDDAWYERMEREYGDEEFDADALLTDEYKREHLREQFAHGCAKYADVWDNLGDAREDWEKLADDWTRLKKLAGEEIPTE